MKRALKWIWGAVFLILLIPIVCFLLYAGTVFLPVKGDIDKIVSSAAFEDSHSSKNIRSLIRASLNSDTKPSGFVARLLVLKFRTNERGFVQAWQLQWAAWAVLVDLVYDEDSVYTLFCALVYNGEGNGLNELSIRMFSKPLSSLTLDESAQVVAYTRAPNIYKKELERLHPIKSILLNKIGH